MTELFYLWAWFTFLTGFVAFVFALVNVLCYSDTMGPKSKRETKQNTMWYLVVLVTCWAWPVWCLVLVFRFLSKTWRVLHA